MTYNKSIRQCIQKDDDELLIFGADSFSQFPRRDTSVLSRCDRALPIARKNDLVLLLGNLDFEYQEWLHSNSLGSDHVIEYKVNSNEKTLSELVIKNPEPIKKIIQKIGKNPVYIPWFSGHMENEAAKILKADLFGASEFATIKYNDKASFKIICQQMNIPVVQGNSFKLYPDDKENFLKFESIINKYLAISEIVIIRGTLGEAGMSLYKTNGNDLDKLYTEIKKTGEKTIIIEPFLTVTSSPNDQWIIDRKGNINHLSVQQQICEKGMIHVGTLKGEKIPQAVLDYISKTSLKIVTHMAEFGYKGVIGIDYIVTDKGIFPIENNARFNGSSYVNMIVENIEEKLVSTIPFWKFLKIKTTPCSFLELTQQMNSVLYDGKKLNSVFPFNCDDLIISGNFSVLLLAETLDKIIILEESLKEIGIKR